MQLSRLIAFTAAGLVASAGVSGCSLPASARHVTGAEQSVSAPPPASASPSGQPSVLPSGLQVAPEPGGPARVKARAAALADVSTKQLLWSRQLDARRPIGSITKVMTALVIIRAGGLNRKIRIPHAALEYVAKYQGESAGLRPRDVLTVRQLLEALLIESACDAAYVLATTYGPGIPKFLTKMNGLAAQLGMTDTHFTSPDGLPYPTEYSTYSTPADLLTLGLAAMKSAVFRSIVDQKFYHVRKSKQHHSYWWDNTNGLIGNYPGADGIKTGYTDAARHCLLFEAVRHGRTLLGVVLGSPVTGPDAAALAASHMLNWGFRIHPAASS